jgi:hypothetical protein
LKKNRKKKCLGAQTPRRMRRFPCLQDCLLTLTWDLACNWNPEKNTVEHFFGKVFLPLQYKKNFKRFFPSRNNFEEHTHWSRTRDDRWFHDTQVESLRFRVSKIFFCDITIFFVTRIQLTKIKSHGTVPGRHVVVLWIHHTTTRTVENNNNDRYCISQHIVMLPQKFVNLQILRKFLSQTTVVICPSLLNSTMIRFRRIRKTQTKPLPKERSRYLWHPFTMNPGVHSDCYHEDPVQVSRTSVMMDVL